MSLHIEYFREQSAKENELHNKGYLLLDDLLEKLSLSEQKLVELKLLAPRKLKSTADLLENFPSELGKRFFNFNECYQIIYLKKSKLRAFMDFIRGN